MGIGCGRVVRMVLAPATMALLDRVDWWLPRWLDGMLPNVDVEAERLLAALHAESRAEPEMPVAEPRELEPV